MIRPASFAFTVFGWLLPFGLSIAVQDGVQLQNPDSRVQSYLEGQREKISQLEATIASKDAEVQERKKAFLELTMISDESALRVAGDLVHDDSLEIAQEAVAVLSNEIVLTSAQHMSTTEIGNSSSLTYSRKRFKAAIAALQAASVDARSQVRLPALKSLVRISDQDAIDSLRKAAIGSEISQPEAVRICAQAASNFGKACVMDFLNSGSLEGKTAAISVLGSMPSERSMIRNKIFLNSSAEPKLRSAAANVLSSYDPKFSSYAFSVIADPQLPTEVYASTLKGFAISTQADGKLDAAQWVTIKEALNHKIQAVEKTKLQSDSDDLKVLRGLQKSFLSAPPVQ